MSVSSRAGLLLNQEEGEEEDEDVLDTGSLETISQEYESLDYFTNFNSLLLDEIRKRGFKFVTRTVRRYISQMTCFILCISGHSAVDNYVIDRNHYGIDRMLHCHNNRHIR